MELSPATVSLRRLQYSITSSTEYRVYPQWTIAFTADLPDVHLNGIGRDIAFVMHVVIGMARPIGLCPDLPIDIVSAIIFWSCLLIGMVQSNRFCSDLPIAICLVVYLGFIY